MKALRVSATNDGIPSWAIPIQTSDGVFSGDSGVTNHSMAIPTEAVLAIISSATGYWVRMNAAATIPTTFGTGAGHESARDLASVVIEDGDTDLNIICEADQKLYVAFYKQR